MEKSRTNFGASVSRVYKAEDGTPHLVFLASGPEKDKQGERMTGKSLDNLVETAKAGKLYLTPAHNVPLMLGKSSDGFKDDEGHTFVDFAVKADNPVAFGVFEEFEKGEWADRQVSVHGYAVKKASYDETTKSQVTDLDDMDFDHVCLTYPDRAVYQNAGCVSAVLKALEDKDEEALKADGFQADEIEKAMASFSASEIYDAKAALQAASEIAWIIMGEQSENEPEEAQVKQLVAAFNALKGFAISELGEDHSGMEAAKALLKAAGEVDKAEFMAKLQPAKAETSEEAETGIEDDKPVEKADAEEPMYWEEDEVAKAAFSEDERKKLAKSGDAMPDGSFPIRNKADLKNAIKAYGRAKDKPAAKAHIVKRAKALDCADMLPADWSDSSKKTAKKAEDEPSEIGKALERITTLEGRIETVAKERDEAQAAVATLTQRLEKVEKAVVVPGHPVEKGPDGQPMVETSPAAAPPIDMKEVEKAVEGCTTVEEAMRKFSFYVASKEMGAALSTRKG